MDTVKTLSREELNTLAKKIFPIICEIITTTKKIGPQIMVKELLSRVNFAQGIFALELELFLSNKKGEEALNVTLGGMILPLTKEAIIQCIEGTAKGKLREYPSTAKDEQGCTLYTACKLCSIDEAIAAQLYKVLFEEDLVLPDKKNPYRS